MGHGHGSWVIHWMGESREDRRMSCLCLCLCLVCPSLWKQDTCQNRSNCNWVDDSKCLEAPQGSHQRRAKWV
jgi:hypothetical protein